MSELYTAVGAAVAVYKLGQPLLKKVLGGALEEVNELGREFVKSRDFVIDFRAKNAAKTLDKTGKMLQDIGVEPQAVAPKILLPWLDGASLEDDEFLQTAWAALLANEANPHSKSKGQPGFTEIMKQLMPIHIQILTAVLDDLNSVPNENKVAMSSHRKDILAIITNHAYSENEFDVALDNLQRLGLCNLSALDGVKDMKEVLANGLRGDGWFELIMYALPGKGLIGITDLGFAFIQACKPPVA